MDFAAIIEQVAKLAVVTSKLVPTIGAGVEIGEKVIELIDAISSKTPANVDTTDLRSARHELRTAVSAKAQATADRLEG